jgi:hypothetical protein
VELRRLEHFLAVVMERSFTAAAARVFMVQSSLSASLQALERELGTELFVRGRRGVKTWSGRWDARRRPAPPAESTIGGEWSAKQPDLSTAAFAAVSPGRRGWSPLA